MNVPSVVDRQLRFGFPDAERHYAEVSLACDDALPGRRRFRRTSTGWALRMRAPDVGRLEYRLMLTARDGSVEVVCDPGNPERVRTAFGERSVAVLPGYAPPAWLHRDAPPGDTAYLEHHDTDLEALPMTIWSPAGLAGGDPAPLLVVHDGPEYVELAGLTSYAAAMVDARTLPPFRMALMHPVRRDEWYAANPDYIRAELAALETVGATFPVSGPVVAMGASLGGLTALLLALAAPARVGGVLAQSGSFFRADLDSQEGGYPSFARVVDAVRRIERAEPTGQRLTVALTCGVLEENYANNLEMFAALLRLGHEVRFFDVRDLHNYTAWRDSLDPALTGLLRSVWGARG
jgi:enterochelin esterase family protein